MTIQKLFHTQVEDFQLVLLQVLLNVLDRLLVVCDETEYTEGVGDEGEV